MTSPVVTRLLKSNRSVVQHIETNAERLDEKLKALLKPYLRSGEKMPDFALGLTLMGRLLAAEGGELAAADEANEAEKLDDPALLRALEDANESLYKATTRAREMLAGAFTSKALASLGFKGDTPRSPDTLVRFATNVLAALDSHTLTPVDDGASVDVKKLIAFLQTEMKVKKIRFPETSGIGIKPVSRDGTERLVRAAIRYALDEKRKSVTFVHKGNIMKFTEGAFRDWGYALAIREFRADVVTERESWIFGNKESNADLTNEANARLVEPGFDMAPPDFQAELVAEVDEAMKLWETHGAGRWKSKLMIKDSIADITLQQVLTRAEAFDVIATLNLNGDYLSDALAAQVGGIGIAPGGNINYLTGHAIFEATHGTAPKYANLDQVNPGSVILSGEMMLRHLGWKEAADLVIKGMDGAIGAKRVTYDFARQMEGATKVKCSEFGDAVIAHM